MVSSGASGNGILLILVLIVVSGKLPGQKGVTKKKQKKKKKKKKKKNMNFWAIFTFF